VGTFRGRGGLTIPLVVSSLSGVHKEGGDIASRFDISASVDPAADVIWEAGVFLLIERSL